MCLMGGSKVIRIVRSFYPIGQGAFYGERFFEDNKCIYSIVYDCGVEVVRTQQENLVRHAFSKDDIINYLFISHLDEDHISLVMTLKKAVRKIERIVLPFVNLNTISKLIAISKLIHDESIYSFLNYIRQALLGETPPNDETELIYILPNEQEADGEYMKVSVRGSGQPIRYCTAKWVFIPYNKHQERKIELDKQLSILLSHPVFIKETNQLGMSIKTNEDLMDSLCSDCFTDLINNPEIKRMLQRVYKSITGTINQNSLLLYSGPEHSSNEYYMLFAVSPLSAYLSCPFCCFHRSRRVACLYTGDGDLSMDEYKHDLNKYWKHIGTIQLPHHGSLRSFKFPQNVNAFDRSYCFPVSCGDTNKYGHPSGKVISFLLSQGCLPIVITERSSSRYEQVIEFDDCFDVKTDLNQL